MRIVSIRSSVTSTSPWSSGAGSGSTSLEAEEGGAGAGREASVRLDAASSGAGAAQLVGSSWNRQSTPAFRHQARAPSNASARVRSGSPFRLEWGSPVMRAVLTLWAAPIKAELHRIKDGIEREHHERTRIHAV